VAGSPEKISKKHLMRALRLQQQIVASVPQSHPPPGNWLPSIILIPPWYLGPAQVVESPEKISKKPSTKV
jgi:hypothetical protein